MTKKKKVSARAEEPEDIGTPEPEEVVTGNTTYSDPPAPSPKFTPEPKLPPLGPNEKYFEAPDGRILAGPSNASSIPDPLYRGREINPMRSGGPRR